MSLNYDYAASKQFCEQIGLHWLGDDFVRNADADAHRLAYTQEQVDAGMRHHLWQVKWLFTPKNYTLLQRAAMAFMFLTGIGAPK